MDAITRLQIDKTTHTFADDLVIHGAARLFDTLLKWQEGDRAQTRIVDHGPYVEIILTPPLEQATIDATRDTPLHIIDAIQTAKNADTLPEGIPLVSYEEQREITNAFFEGRRKGLDESALTKPSRDWDVYRAINPAALPGYNGLVTDWWTAREAQPEIIHIILDLFSQTPNDLDTAIAAWKAFDKEYGWKISAETTCQQLYNPDQGKGHNSPKPMGLSIGNVKNFWLLEWLKAVGFYQGALTRQVRGAKDRKTFVVAVRELSVTANREVLNRFVDAMQVSQTSIKFDILAAIRYTRELLGYIAEQEPQHDLRRGHRRPITKKLVRGFQTAFYKDMGNAVATMNLSFIALPGWVEVGEDVELNAYTPLLDEIEQLARQFDESHSDDYNLLLLLRDFVSGDDLRAFFKFTTAYPAYLMGRRERGKYAYALTTEFIERLIEVTEKPLSVIVRNPGFQNIAYAIRQSTVTAQFRKKQGDRKYDVRYGLGQELSRKARYPADFIAALSDFLHNYNAENAQVMETRPKPYRRSIQTADIDEIVTLIDEYGAETVAKLLIAYGYARVPRDPEQYEEQYEVETEEGE